MRAIVIFNREKLQWKLVQLNLHINLQMSLKSLKTGFTKLGRLKFPIIIEVEIDSFEVTGDNSFTWVSSELPETPTIEECIAENRANIMRQSLPNISALRII